MAYIKKDIETNLYLGQQYDTMRSALDQDKDNMLKIIGKLKSAKKIILTGSGSSYNAAKLGESLFCELGYDAQAIPAFNLEKKEKMIGNDSAVIVMSLSEDDMDIILPLESLKEKYSPDIISMTDVSSSTISEEIADLNISLNRECERALEEREIFTSQQILLRYLYYGLDGRLDEGEETIRNCIDKMSRYETRFQDIKKLSSYLANADNIIILGKGINYSVAMEAERMFDIYTDISARAYESGEFKHGPLTMIKNRGDQFDINNIVIAIAPHDETYPSIKNTIEQIKTREGNVIELTNLDDEESIDRIKLKGENKEDNDLKMPTLDFYENAEIILLQNLVVGVAEFQGHCI